MERLGEVATRLEADDHKIVDFLERCRFTDLPTDWSAVVGHDHAKRELRVVAAALARRDLAERLGIPLVKGILITGPSGSGKTLLARAFAGSVDRPVFVLSSAELSPVRIRRIYAALADVPCVVVIDEIDVIARRPFRRQSRDRTVGALCVALDGVVPVTGPVTIGLTAEPLESFDPSVIRSGRLTTKIVLEAPKRAERLALWAMYTAKVPTTGQLDLEEAADRSQGMTGADISAVALAAAGLALADGLDALDQGHLDEALERRGLVRPRPADDDLMRRAVAIHEAGHAVYAYMALGASSLNDMVISRTGRGEGHVALRTEFDEQHALAGRHWRVMVRLSLAGQVAEQLMLGDRAATFGSEQDIAKATELVLRAAENGLLRSFGMLSATRIEAGIGNTYDPVGSEAMRAELYQAVRHELDRAAADLRANLRPVTGAIGEVAEALLAAGSLSGPVLTDVVRATGVPEGRTDA